MGQFCLDRSESSNYFSPVKLIVLFTLKRNLNMTTQGNLPKPFW